MSSTKQHDVRTVFQLVLTKAFIVIVACLEAICEDCRCRTYNCNQTIARKWCKNHITLELPQPRVIAITGLENRHSATNCAHLFKSQSTKKRRNTIQCDHDACDLGRGTWFCATSLRIFFVYQVYNSEGKWFIIANDKPKQL